MHKKEMFLKNKEIKKKNNNIIFLNIDGVIKTSKQDRFDHDLLKTQEYLSIKYNDDIYNRLNQYDIGAVFYDFDYIALGILREMIERFSANIVISSDWRDSKNLEELKALFKIYDLDRFIIDTCEAQDIKNYHFISKEEAIRKYISTHQIDNYIIFDDYDYTNLFGSNFRRTSNALKINDINYANIIFNQKLNIIEDDKYIKLISNNEEIINIRYINYKCHDLNIVYGKVNKINYYEYGKRQYLEYLINYLTKEKNVDYILINTSNINDKELNISGAMDDNKIYTINKTYNDVNHQIKDCKRKILSIDNS